MAKQNKAFKFRLIPNREQSVLLVKTFGCVRFVYNKMLAERKEIRWTPSSRHKFKIFKVGQNLKNRY